MSEFDNRESAEDQTTAQTGTSKPDSENTQTNPTDAAENLGKDGSDQVVDGTYRYSARDAEKDPGEYRKPPYMRDEIGGSSSSYDSSGSTNESAGSSSYGAGSTNESAGSGSTNGSTGSTGTGYGTGSGSAGSSSAGTSGSADNRYSYVNGEDRSGYSYSSGSGGNGGNGGDSRFSYDSSSGGGQPPKKRNTGKIAAIVIAIAVVAGAAIGGGSYILGNQMSGGSSAETQIAKESTTSGSEDSGTSAADSGTTQASSETTASGETTASESSGSKSLTSSSSTIAVAGAASSSEVYATDVSSVVSNAMPSVVAITTSSVYESYSSGGYDPYEFFYGNSGNNGSYEVTGAGSGIIIGDDGEELWIVTNNHVVEDADSLTVSFCDDTTADAYVKGTDSENDLAVVGIKLSDLKDSTKSTIRAAQIGDSDSLELGQTVIAIGNALGLGQSVSTGVVSAVNREITTSEGTTLTTIQTDAAINPGNSGGALLNSKGELIGINVAKDSETSVEGMGYAIPISSAISVIDNLTTMEPRTAVSDDEYPYLGVQLTEISSQTAETYNMPDGVMVVYVEEGSPAADAGIVTQDIITSFNGVDISSYDDLQNEMQYVSGGTTVDVKVQRLENGEYVEKTLSVTLGYKKDHESSTDSGSSNQQDNSSGQQNDGSTDSGVNGWSGFGN